MNAYLTLVLDWFYQKKLAHQIGLIGGIFFIIVSGLMVAKLVFSHPYDVLFSGLEPREASELIKQLEQEQINYQLIDQGHTILIAKSLIEKMRLKLANPQILLKNNVGFELFDRSDFGLTDFSQKINYQRALQGELERTIMSLAEVSYARVHLVMPEKHLFQDNRAQAQAAVNLHLKQPLTQAQVTSIVQLISTSVENLDKKRVIIVDQNGNNLAKNSNNEKLKHLNFKKSTERYLADKIHQLLNKIFNTDQLMVNINLDIDYDRLKRESIKPQATGIVSQEKQSHQVIHPKAKSKAQENSNTEKIYTLGQEKEYFTKAFGSIKRLTVSVALPENVTLAERVKVESLIKSAVGFDSQRGDSVSVEAIIPQKFLSNAPIVLPSKPTYISYFWLFLITMIAMVAGSVMYQRKMIQKRRKLLLLELNQWLNHHA